MKPRSLILFEESCKSEVTKRNYSMNFARFLKWASKDPDSLLMMPQIELDNLLADYVIYLKKRMSPNSVPSHLWAIACFLDANGKSYNKTKLMRLLPEKVKAGGDRAITTEELRLMLRVAGTKRERALIHLFSATGHRPEAIAGLRIGDIGEMQEGYASVVFYADSLNEHIGFLHPEAKQALDEYLEERKKQGELFKPESYVIRKTRFVVTESKPKPMTVHAIDKIVSRVLKKSDIVRNKKGNRFDLPVCMGMRKRFDIILKKNPDISFVVAETLMDHKVKLESHYFKPTKQELFEEYKKAVSELVINPEFKLREEVKRKDELIKQYSSDARLEIESIRRQMHENRLDTLRMIGEALKDPEKFKKMLSESKQQELDS